MLAFTIILTGCGTASKTEYSIEPIVKANGTVVCCKAHVFNSKNYDKLKFTLKKLADGTIEISLDENGVETLTSENNSKILETINKIIPVIK